MGSTDIPSVFLSALRRVGSKLYIIDADMITVRLQFMYMTHRPFPRLDIIRTTRSPLQTAFSTDMNGLVLIRSFGKAGAQHDYFLKMLEKNAGAWYWWLIGNRWLGFRLDIMCTLIVSFAVLLGVAVKNTVDSGILGLALVYMISLSGLFQYMVRQSALVETYMTSVERMLYYGTKILTEEEYQKDGLDAFEQDPLTAPFDCGKEAAALAADPLWPASGTLTCKGLKCKYREDLPIVLDGVDFEVESGSKLGTTHGGCDCSLSLSLSCWRDWSTAIDVPRPGRMC